MAGELAAKIRAKYPGAYDGVDDATLEKQVIAKYPQYATLQQPDPSMSERFIAGLTGHNPLAEKPVTLGDMLDDPKAALGRIFTAENAGATMRDAALMGMGAGLTKSAMNGTLRDVGAGVSGGIQHLPFVGAPIRATVQGFIRSQRGRQAAQTKAAEAAIPWKSGATMPDLTAKTPREMPQLAVPSGSSAKPKLSAQEFTAAMRQQYGSEEAGRRIFGGVQRGAGAGSSVASAAARKEAVKRLAPAESTLPQAARAAIVEQLSGKSAGEAFDYASKAPNLRAKEFFGDQLRQALLERMK